jgi:hypothetical protein
MSMPDHSEGSKYVKSLRDAVKRRYAKEYLMWIRSGRVGATPSRGTLSPIIAKVVCTNLDTLG